MKIYVFVLVIFGLLIVDKIKFEGLLDLRRLVWLMMLML